MSYVWVLTIARMALYFVFMAKQAGNIFIEGTLDDLTFYKMDGVYYVRMKSSLTGKKFWKHQAFERSRESCKRFSEGNRLASRLYRMIEKEKRAYKLFCFLKKRAILFLKEGKNLLQAEELLIGYLQDFGLIEKERNNNDNQGSEVCLTCVFCHGKNFMHINSPAKRIALLNADRKNYACAVGPPNVIGI